VILELFNKLNELRDKTKQIYITRRKHTSWTGTTYFKEYESTTLSCLDGYVNHFFDKIKVLSERVRSCRSLNLIDCISTLGFINTTLIAHLFNLFTTKVTFANDAIFNKDDQGNVLTLDDISRANKDAIKRHIDTTRMMDQKMITDDDVDGVQNSLKEILKYFLGDGIEAIISKYPNYIIETIDN
jgi:hypothetical protein